MSEALYSQLKFADEQSQACTHGTPTETARLCGKHEDRSSEYEITRSLGQSNNSYLPTSIAAVGKNLAWEVQSQAPRRPGDWTQKGDFKNKKDVHYLTLCSLKEQIY